MQTTRFDLNCTFFPGSNRSQKGKTETIVFDSGHPDNAFKLLLSGLQAIARDFWKGKNRKRPTFIASVKISEPGNPARYSRIFFVRRWYSNRRILCARNWQKVFYEPQDFDDGS